MVVHGGCIVETGRHEELIGLPNGIYHRLVALQMLDRGPSALVAIQAYLQHRESTRFQDG